MNPELIWKETLKDLQLQMTQATFDQWLRDSRFVAFENDTFIIGVNTGYAKDWIENRLLGTITRTLARRMGWQVAAAFIVVDRSNGPSGSSPDPDRHEGPVVEEDPPTLVPVPDHSPQGDRVSVEGAYIDARAEILNAAFGLFVQGYMANNWMHRLGLERYCLVEWLRMKVMEGEALKKAKEAGTDTDPGQNKENRNPTVIGSVETSQPEIARSLGKSERTVRKWLASEPIPGEKGWYRIKPVDDESRALALFIPRMCPVYHSGDRTGPKGTLIQVHMDNPLIPEDEVELENLVVSRLTGSEPPPPEETIRRMILEIDPSVTDFRKLRHKAHDIAERTADLLNDEQSYQMYYKVLKTLHRIGRLDVFVAALEAGIRARAAGWKKPGAGFIEELKDTSANEDIYVGIGPE
jgi:hypothetical protein